MVLQPSLWKEIVFLFGLGSVEFIMSTVARRPSCQYRATTFKHGALESECRISGGSNGMHRIDNNAPVSGKLRPVPGRWRNRCRNGVWLLGVDRWFTKTGRPTFFVFKECFNIDVRSILTLLLIQEMRCIIVVGCKR